MAFTELLKSIIDSSKDRIKKPIAGAFLLSFIFYNRAPILYFIFSKSEVEDKLQVLAAIFELNFLSFFVPFVMAIIYVLGLPYLTFVLNKFLNKQKIDSLGLIYDVKDERAEREKKLQEKIAGNKEIQDLNEQIKNLTDENTNLKETINLNNTNHNKIVSDLNQKIAFQLVEDKYDIIKLKAFEMGFSEAEYLKYRLVKISLTNTDFATLKSLSRGNDLNNDNVNNNFVANKFLEHHLAFKAKDKKSYAITEFGLKVLKLYDVDELL